MPGGQNRGRGNRGGPRGRPYRGRGRGRGGFGGGGGSEGYHTLSEMGEVYLMADSAYDITRLSSNTSIRQGTVSPRARGRGRGGSNSNSGSKTPRGRGKGRGGTSNDFTSPRGRGGFNDFGSPRGPAGISDNSPRGGRGRGRGGSKLGRDAPLSDLLFQERPLLRPIVFVPSVHTKTLFQEEEDILQAVVEEVGDEEQSHVPTADRVFRVFSGGNIPRMPSEAEDDNGDEDELEEIDFNDLAKIMETQTRPVIKTEVEVVEEQFLGIRLGSKSTPELPSPAEGMDVDTAQLPQVVLQDSSPSAVEGTPVMIDDAPVHVPTPPPDVEPLGPILVTDNSLSIQLQQEPVIIQEQTTSAIIIDDNLQESISNPPRQGSAPMATEELTGFCIDTDPSPVDEPAPAPTEALQATVADSPQLDHKISEMTIEQIIVATNSIPATAHETFDGLFYIDTQPSQLEAPHQGKPQLLEDDEEIIVYVPPHPGRVSPLRPSTSTSAASFLPSTSILTGTTTLSQIASTSTSTTSTPPPPRRQAPPPSFDSVSFSFTPTPKKGREFSSLRKNKAKAQLKQRRQERHAKRSRLERQVLFGGGSFGSFGGMMEEAKLRGSDYDPQWDDRRRGDSDVEWGDSDEEQDVGAEGENGLAEGMDLDPDLEGAGEAMKRFARSMGAEGSRFVTMDDIADGEMMRMEDLDAERERWNMGSSGEDEDETTDDDKEVEEIVRTEERRLIAESGDMDGLEDESDESDEDDSDDDDFEGSPRASFQARLERLRKGSTSAKGKGKLRAAQGEDEEDSDEGDDDDYFDRADEDEFMIEEMMMALEKNSDVLGYGNDRKARNRLFRAVRNGAFEDLNDLLDFKPARKSKDKYKDLPPELQEQWKKDRDKKAENKRLRYIKRLEFAADPMSPNKGGKKGRKAMLAAAKLDPTITILPNRVIDMTTLVQQIRRFVNDLNGPQTMSLPPTTKETRKAIHEMALAFNLKSVSKGKGDARYTTLSKT
ncbi:hypothetical protein H0H87_012089, partial [Tephrocybe sp. NHM501043]